MNHSNDDVAVAQPEILTLHWEGPSHSEPAPDHHFPDSPDEVEDARRAEFENELAAIERSRQGSEIWAQIERRQRPEETAISGGASSMPTAGSR